MARAEPLAPPAGTPAIAGGPEDVTPFVRREADGSHRLHLLVEGVHCGACVRRIERSLAREPEVLEARVNLTTRRLVVRWQGEAARANELAARVRALGYGAVPFDPERLAAGEAREARELLRAMAVAGFAAGNIMLLAVSVWAGHASEDMGPATRQLFHWIEALLALPAVAYAGRPFFRSALAALRAGHTNMDVPISLAVLLAPAVSLFETLRGGPHVYFDSAVTLLFFLLVGRYLDRRARGAARAAAERLLALLRGTVTVLRPDGTTAAARPDQLARGDEVLVAVGERVPVDGVVVRGRGGLDTSLLTGETVPRTVTPGSRVYAGSVNLEAPLVVRVEDAGEGTLLAEIVRLMEAVEQRRGRYVALADRIAGWYAPAVHTLAALAFLGWWLVGGLSLPEALLIATAVLIITCPCALGLAVPAVQVIAAQRLMRRGILLKSATALERFAAVDTVVFDKTGTLTEGRPAPLEEDLAVAHGTLLAGLARASRHPLARALAARLPAAPVPAGVEEVPGEGLRLCTPEGEWRLGRRTFVAPDAPPGADHVGPELWFAGPGLAPHRIRFRDRPREDAARVVRALRARGLRLLLLSGDRREAVARVAGELGVDNWRAELRPDGKVHALEALRRAGARPLMVGDGLNDAPALAAAHASLSPAEAADISQTAADAVFQGRRLAPVLEVLTVARRAERLVRQNLVLAFAYNAVAVPLALAGLVTPLIAAVAMSASSLTVVGNAFRLALDARA